MPSLSPNGHLGTDGDLGTGTKKRSAMGFIGEHEATTDPLALLTGRGSRFSTGYFAFFEARLRPGFIAGTSGNPRCHYGISRPIR